ncbi:MAG: EAL domain-containing protein, partial [Clostridia bacterium]|nr:EAL domain-containing protein [Clostridia bacterium]
ISPEATDAREWVHAGLLAFNGLLTGQQPRKGEEAVGCGILRLAMEYGYEHYDGSGVPSGMRGNDIPPVGGIVAVSRGIAERMLAGNTYKSTLSWLKEAEGTVAAPPIVQAAVLVAEQCYNEEKEQLDRYASDRLREIELIWHPVVDCQIKQTVRLDGEPVIQNPKQGAIQSQIFLPVAERNGRIAPLTILWLEQLCEKLAYEKYENGPAADLLIPLSAVCLQKKSFLAAVKKTITTYQVDPKRITWAVSETALSYENGPVTDGLRAMKQMGFSLVLDHFGEEYASLSRLAEWPFDGIKIDRAFVERVAEDKATYEIVKSIINLARSLKLKVVASGVDHLNQKDLLAELGCQYMQGAYFN